MENQGRPLIPLDKERIIPLYLNGMNSYDIGQLFGVSWSTIIRRLRKWSIPIKLQAHIKGHTAWNKGLTCKDDERVKINSENNSRFSGHKHTEETRLKMSKSRKGQNTWSKGRGLSSTHLAKILKSNSLRPTKPENRILDVITKYNLPFKYTGNGSVILNGICPDFINTNGVKAVIEVFGDYWHGRKEPEKSLAWHRTELGRIMRYNSLGFDCIVLWESDISTMTDEDIVRRIRNESTRLSKLHVKRAERQKIK